jgi:hypothetical protein
VALSFGAMPARIDVVYSTTARLDWTEVVTCPHCGYRSKAGVVVANRGTGRAAYGIGQEAARDRAGINAFTGAVDGARLMLQRARCPKCQKRAGGVPWLAVKSFFLWSFVASVVLGVAVSNVAPNKSPGVLCIGGIGVIAMTVFTVRRRLRVADACVRFEPIMEVPEHVVRTPPRTEPARPAPRAPEPKAEAADDSGLELDVDRKWNK